MYVAKAMSLTDGNFRMKKFAYALKKPTRLTVWGSLADKINAGGK